MASTKRKPKIPNEPYRYFATRASALSYATRLKKAGIISRAEYYGMGGKQEWVVWIGGNMHSSNPRTRLKPNRLTPVSFTVKGKRHTGKAKRVGNVVKVFVTPGVARKINPAASTYDVLYTDSTGVTRVYTSVRLTRKQAQEDVKQAKRRGYKKVRIVKV